MLTPTYSLTIGRLQSTTENPAGGVRQFVVQRGMDIPADAWQVQLMQRVDIGLGDEVVLELGHERDEQRVFTGSVEKIQPAIQGVTIFGLGKMNQLLNLRTSATYENQSAGVIANDLISQAGLQAGTVENGPDLPRMAIDHRTNAFDHLKGLADRLGFELYANKEGDVMFHPLGAAAELDSSGLGGAVGAVSSQLAGGGIQQYVYAQHILSAQAVHRPQAWNKVQVGGESPMSGQGESTAHWLTVNDKDYRGSAGSGDPAALYIDFLARSKDIADRIAAGRLALKQRTAYALEMRVLGQPQLELGDSVSSAEMPDSLIDGEGYIRKLHHYFSADCGFVTDMVLSVAA